MFLASRPCSCIVLLQDIFASIALEYYLVYLLHIHASDLIRGQNGLYFFISFLSHTYYIFYFEYLGNLHVILYLVFPERGKKKWLKKYIKTLQ